MTMSITQTIDPPTDVAEYRESFPEYWRCRENRHDWHATDGNYDEYTWTPEWTPGPRGGSWLYTKVAECARCHMVRTKRRHVVIRRGAAVITRLNPHYDDTKCREFRAKGIRITSAVAEDMDLTLQIQSEPARPRGRRK